MKQQHLGGLQLRRGGAGGCCTDLGGVAALHDEEALVGG